MKVLISILTTLVFSFPVFASNVSSLSYASSNVSTGSYATFVASTPINVTQIVLCDTSGQVVKLAVGAALSEVDYFTMPVSSCMLMPLSPTLAAGARLSLKAISNTASVGYATVSFLK